MATDNLCFYHGELYRIVSQALAQKIGAGEIGPEVAILAINKVEHADCKTISRVAWVRLEEVYQPISAIDFQFSEWHMGVTGAKN